MAAVYLAVGWLLMQVAVALETAIGLPAWFDGMVIALLAIGFPLVLLFAWAYEITPEGLKTSAEVEAAGLPSSISRKFDIILIGAATLAIVVVGADRLLPKDAAAPSAGAAPGGRSIAVLPFLDLSPAGDQEYFADGLSEELLNVLAQSRDLKVAGRTSSFAFKDQNRDLREIGEILNVTHILEGSVRKSGARIRVTAQLIKASDGYHVFSETYDRQLKDVFAVQDDIAGKIGAALKARLAGDAATHSAPTDVAAYDLYLLAREHIYTRDPGQMREARKHLDDALALDPDYAPALAQKAILALLTSNAVSSYGDTPLAEAVAEARALVDRALDADPDLAEAHAALGFLRINIGAPLDQVEAALRRALTINPNLADAQNWLALALEQHGHPIEALAIHENTVARDPLFRPAYNNLTSSYAMRRQFDKAEALVARVERIIGENSEYALLTRGLLALEKGELADAVAKFQVVYERKTPSNVLRANYTSALMQIGDLEAALDVASPPAQATILHLMGRREEAAAAIERVGAPASGQVEILAPVFNEFAWTGRYEDAARYIERHFGTVQAAAEGRLSSTPSWVGPLALAYRELGRKAEFADAMRLVEDALTQARKAGVDGAYYWLSLAELAVLRGETDLAIERLRTVAAKGFVNAFGFPSPVFDDLRGDERFRAIEAEMRDRAAAERVKLDLSKERLRPRLDRHNRQ